MLDIHFSFSEHQDLVCTLYNDLPVSRCDNNIYCIFLYALDRGRVYHSLILYNYYRRIVSCAFVFFLRVGEVHFLKKKGLVFSLQSPYLYPLTQIHQAFYSYVCTHIYLENFFVAAAYTLSVSLYYLQKTATSACWFVCVRSRLV